MTIQQTGQARMTTTTPELRIIETWGWYSWEEGANGARVRWSGAQNLHTEAEARAHHARATAPAGNEVSP